MPALDRARIAHYEILERVGAGGMGVVWKAKDTRLMRLVALKSLGPARDGSPASRERLIQEARAASQLDHPNICSIYQVEELPDDEVVIVMAFYHGETLADRIQRGPLDPDTAVDILGQLLSGLEHAHQRGVIHRDVKPANLILCENGLVKIVDFGLAKDLGTGKGLTATGEILGTISYLSPEQVLCKKLDHRTDLWASGVVLYEMLSGTHPFSATSSYEVLDAILRKPHRRIREHVSDVPYHLEQIIERALDKDIDRRFQNAREFQAALHAPSTSHLYRTTQKVAVPEELRIPAVQANHTILVLPFTGDSDDPEIQDFCDGLTDEIITDLSSVHSLRTICSTSSMRLKNSPRSPAEIAAELGVRNVLRGSVRIQQSTNTSNPQSGRAIRVTTQLFDAHTDTLIWGDKYRGSTEDAFAIQESISRQIVSALKVTLSPQENQQLEARPLPDVRAVQFYVKAKQEILNYSREGLNRALEYLEMGERVVGKNALLLSTRGQVYWQYLNAGISPDMENLLRAKACAAEAAQLDPDSPHVLRLQGLINIQEGKTQEAILLLKRSIAADPNDSDSLSWYSALCALSGKAHAAMPLARRILEIDPLTPVYRFLPGLLSMSAGEFADAIPSFDEAIRLDPKNPLLLCLRGQALALDGKIEQAITQFEAMPQQCGDHYLCRMGSVMVAALRGDAATAEKYIDAEFEEITAADPQWPWMLAQCYALLGKVERAIAWLEVAVSKGFLNYPMLGRWDPLLTNLRGHDDFIALMKRTRELWERFEV
jgi:serine/threonine protein kinase/tetratricopeptide (TPR) repeat protein